MKDRFMRMSDGAYCPVCGKWIPDASNFREDYEQDEISMVIECKDCEAEIVAYRNPLQEGESE